MHARTTSFLLAASLLLVGAGCMPATTSPDATPDADGSAVTAPTNRNDDRSGTNGSAADVNEGARVVTTNGVVDETWQTYVNEARGFSFNWPTRGRYAPMWSVRFVGNDDLNNGCFGGETMHRAQVTVGDATFCHAASATDAATTDATDHYVTTVDGTNVLITFTKGSAGMGGDFSWDDYRSHLDLIVSTFRRS